MKKSTRYSDEELKEFEEILNAKIAKSNKEIASLQEQISELGRSMGSDRSDLVDSTISHSEGERLRNMLYRVQKHHQGLLNAMSRIRNKTYGVCMISGELIDKRRLRAVPTTTKSLEVKLKPPKQSGGKRTIRSTAKKIIEKIIKPKAKKSKATPPPPMEEEEDGEKWNAEAAEMSAAELEEIKAEISSGEPEEGFADLPGKSKE